MTNGEVSREARSRGSSASALSKIIGIIALSSAVVGFSFRYVGMKNDHALQIRMLERSLVELKAAINTDSIRQHNIKKVLTIIDRYNPDMSEALKYEIASEIYAMSIKYPNLDVDLICATITHESGRSWNPRVSSPAGAMGLMQVMPLTGRYISEVEGITWTSAEDILYDPILNIRLGCRYLSSMVRSYELDGGLAAYNGGERIAALWLKNNRADGILWNETSKYVPSVLKLYEEYKAMN
ncbi:MAG TPA: lytic transglycosylase domain-containing protein [Bacteroidetes bacterium]|nr:lytic transglycosylase domain-containing protein [Bacteroidota bacterium]